MAKQEAVLLVIRPPSSDAGADECTICSYAMGAGNDRTLPCGHAFHAACIGEWAARVPTCPLCRAPFAPEDALCRCCACRRRRRRLAAYDDGDCCRSCVRFAAALAAAVLLLVAIMITLAATLSSGQRGAEVQS